MYPKTRVTNSVEFILSAADNPQYAAPIPSRDHTTNILKAALNNFFLSPNSYLFSTQIITYLTTIYKTTTLKIYNITKYKIPPPFEGIIFLSRLLNKFETNETINPPQNQT